MRLDDRIALITGAAKGIGAGIAERFLQAGASVVIFDIDRDAAAATAARLGMPDRIFVVAGDVSREDDVKRAVEQTVARFQRLDILVNNAGIEVPGAIPDLTEAEWDRQIDVNLRGVFLFCKYAIPRMRNRRGAIVNISSVHAFVSYPGNAAYDASKAGLIGLTRALALDHGPEGIRANAICPGYIDTPMMDEWLKTLADPAETMRQVIAAHPVGRIGTPRDIAEAALFLASDESSFISGTYLVVDGAMIASGH